MTPQNITFDQFAQDCQIKLLLKIIEEAGIKTKEEMEREYKILFLESLREARKQLQPMVESARARSKIILPDAEKGPFEA